MKTYNSQQSSFTHLSSQKSSDGFTIIELLVVMVIIGVLAGLVIITFTGMQQRARDTERQTDIRALSSQLEAFWTQKGYYPSLADMNDRAAGGFVDTNFQGLSVNAFKDPRGGSSALAATNSANTYAYTVTNSSDTSCEASSITCSKYVLGASLEGTINGSATYSQGSLSN